MIIAYLCICKFKTHCNPVKKYIYDIRVLLSQSALATGIKTFLDTVQPPEEEVGKMIKFLDTVGFIFTIMRKKLLEFSFFISVRYK